MVIFYSPRLHCPKVCATKGKRYRVGWSSNPVRHELAPVILLICAKSDTLIRLIFCKMFSFCKSKLGTIIIIIETHIQE